MKNKIFQNNFPKLTKYFSPNLEFGGICSESKASISDENKNYENDNQSNSADEYQPVIKLLMTLMDIIIVTMKN